MPHAAKQHKSSSQPATLPCREYSGLYNYQWSQASKGFLRQVENRFCVQCKADGRLVLATVTDHIKPHRGDPALFWDLMNLQGLCARHHNAKTKAGQ